MGTTTETTTETTCEGCATAEALYGAGHLCGRHEQEARAGKENADAIMRAILASSLGSFEEVQTVVTLPLGDRMRARQATGRPVDAEALVADAARDLCLAMADAAQALRNLASRTDEATERLRVAVGGHLFESPAICDAAGRAATAYATVAERRRTLKVALRAMVLAS